MVATRGPEEKVMIDELSKFYSRKEGVDTAAENDPREMALEALIDEPAEREIMTIGTIFELPRYRPLIRRRNRVRSSSIV